MDAGVSETRLTRFLLFCFDHLALCRTRTGRALPAASHIGYPTCSSLSMPHMHVNPPLTEVYACERCTATR